MIVPQGISRVKNHCEYKNVKKFVTRYVGQSCASSMDCGCLCKFVLLWIRQRKWNLDRDLFLCVNNIKCIFVWIFSIFKFSINMYININGYGTPLPIV